MRPGGPRAVHKGEEEPRARSRAVWWVRASPSRSRERFPPRLGRASLKAFLPQCLGPGAGEGRPGHQARVLRKQWPFVLPPWWTGFSQRKQPITGSSFWKEPPGRERKVSHCQHPSTNPSRPRGRAPGGADNVHLFTGLGSGGSRTRLPCGSRDVD